MWLIILSSVAGTVLLTAAIVALVFWILRSGPEVGRVQVVDGEAFTLSARAATDGPLTLWCEVDVKFTKRPDLCGPLQISVDGKPVWSGTFSLDKRGATTAGSSSRLTKRWLHGHSVARGVTRIAKVGPPGIRTSITVEGTMTAGEGTEVLKLELFVGC